MRRLSFIISLVIIVLIAWHANSLYQERTKPVLSNELYSHPFWLQGEIIGLPSVKLNHHRRFVFSSQLGNILLDWYGPSPYLVPGQTWRLLIHLQAIGFYHNPGEFDYAAYLKRQGIIAKGYVLPHYYYHRLKRFSLNESLNLWRYKIRQRLLQATKGYPHQGVMLALILGDKSGLDADSWQVLVKSGTSYFVVISGLHIALLAGIIFMCIRWLWPLISRLALWLPSQKAAGIAGLLAALVYSLLAGFTVPTQRAFITITALGLARINERYISSFQAWCLALFLVLLWDPLSVLDAGFWLSFMAVWFLLFCFVGRVGRTNLYKKWVYPQWVIFLGILPVSILYFQQVSIVSLLTNVIAIPIMILGVIPGALLGTLLLFMWPTLGKWVLLLSSKLMAGLWWILAYFAGQNWWGIYLPQPSILTAVLGILGALLLLAPKSIKARYLGVVFILPLILGIGQRPQSSTITLNVPEGKALIIYNKLGVDVYQQNVNLRQAEHIAKTIIVPYLHAVGIRNIDQWEICSKHAPSEIFSQKITSTMAVSTWISC